MRLCSDYFEVAGQLWRLEVYPAGLCSTTNVVIGKFAQPPLYGMSNGIAFFAFYLAFLVTYQREGAMLCQCSAEKHLSGLSCSVLSWQLITNSALLLCQTIRSCPCLTTLLSCRSVSGSGKPLVFVPDHARQYCHIQSGLA